MLNNIMHPENHAQKSNSKFRPSQLFVFVLLVALSQNRLSKLAASRIKTDPKSKIAFSLKSSHRLKQAPPLHDKDLSRDLEEIEQNIKLSLEAVRKQLRLEKPSSASEANSLEKQMQQLQLENSFLKDKEITRDLREGLRIRAQNLLVQADLESNITKKEKLLKQATKIIGRARGRPGPRD